VTNEVWCLMLVPSSSKQNPAVTLFCFSKRKSAYDTTKRGTWVGNCLLVEHRSTGVLQVKCET